MTTHRLAVAGILLAAWATVAAATRGQVNQFAGVALTTTHVAGNVYMVQRPGGGGNVGAFVGPDGVLSGGPNFRQLEPDRRMVEAC